jgi:transcriptional regulator with XRE-family HTH domain
MASPPNKGRTTSLHDEAYARFVQKLVARRLKANVSQQALADALGWNQSVIAKVETVQRRLDVIEFIRMANALGFDASRFVRETQQDMGWSAT